MAGRKIGNLEWFVGNEDIKFKVLDLVQYNSVQGILVQVFSSPKCANLPHFYFVCDVSGLANNRLFNWNNTRILYFGFTFISDTERYKMSTALHQFQPSGFQEIFDVNVWAGIVGTNNVDPIVFWGQLNIFNIFTNGIPAMGFNA